MTRMKLVSKFERSEVDFSTFGQGQASCFFLLAGFMLS